MTAPAALNTHDLAYSVSLIMPTLSAESFFSPKSDSAIMRLFQDVRGIITNLTDFTNSSPDIEALGKGDREFVKLMNATPYASMTSISLPTPEGFQGNLAQYATELHKSAVFAQGFLAKALPEYLSKLAAIASDVNTATASYRVTNPYVQADHEREHHSKELGKHFAHNSHAVEQPLKVLIARQGDWPVLFKAVSDTVHTIDAVNRSTLQKQIKTAAGYIDVIEGNDTQMSKAALMMLGEMTLAVAHMVEFYSLTYYRALALRTSVTATMTRIEEIFG